MRLTEDRCGFGLRGTTAEAAAVLNHLLRAYGQCGDSDGNPYKDIAFVTDNATRAPGTVLEHDARLPGYVNCDNWTCANFFPPLYPGPRDNNFRISIDGTQENIDKIKETVRQLVRNSVQ